MKRISLVVILGMFLTGCGDTMPPKCDSKDVKSSLEKIFSNSGMSNTLVMIPRVLNTDKEKEEYICQSLISVNNGLPKTYKYRVYWGNKDKKIFHVAIVK